MSQQDKQDYLRQDVPIKGQEYICLSYLIKDNVLHALKFKGAFPSLELANKHAKEEQKKDPYYDVLVGEGFKWLPITIDYEGLTNIEYQEEKLQEIAKGYEENINNSKKMEEERKRDLLKSASQNQSKKEEGTEVKKEVREEVKISEEKIKKLDENIAKLKEMQEKLSKSKK